MRRIFAAALLLMAACGPEPDLVLPLTTPLPGPPPRREKLAMMTFGSGARQTPRPPEDPQAAFWERIGTLKVERPKTRLKEDEIEGLFVLLMNRRHSTYRYDEGGRCGQPDPWLTWMISGVYLEAFHFADLYPEIARRHALAILQDQEAPVADVQFALELIRPGRDSIAGELEEELVRLVRQEERGLCWDAVSLLGFSEAARRHRPLFQSLCAEGSVIAFEMISLDPDAENMEFLRKLSVAPPPPDPHLHWVPFRAEEMRRKLETLASPDWKRELIEILTRDKVVDMVDTRGWWAEAVARQRLPEHALEYSRRYIEKVRKQLSASFRDPKAAERPEYGPSFMEQVLRRTRIENVDINFDAALVEYAYQGGELTVWEAKRLEYFGYLGDRETRLQEILEHGFR